jgi:hypothetical protein
MMTQVSLEDEVQRVIDSAGAFADPKWYKEAEATVTLLCRRGEDFTTDDVWQLMEHTGLKTPEPRAMGSIMRQLSKERLIVPTGMYRKSLRPACHRRPVAVWRPITFHKVTRDAE